MKPQKFLPIAAMSLLTISCAKPVTSNKTQDEHIDIPQNISFLALGDGGYNINYPKIKHLKKPRNKADFLAKETQDWLDDYRPIAEFDHAPLTFFPGTKIVTEKSGALAVGTASATLCKQRACDFVIQLGDNIYPDGADAVDGKDDTKRMDDLILAPLQPLFVNNPDLVVYSALGNHDWKTSRKGVALQLDWMEKQKNFHMGAKGYYSYTIGEKGNEIEFFVLDTNMLLAGQTFYELPLNPDGSEKEPSLALTDGELENHKKHEEPIYNEDDKQIAWLENGLSTSTAKWKMVYGHHILWSIGGSKYSEGHVLRKLLLPSLCEYADAYIAGHEHDLELLTDDCSQYPSQKANNQSKREPLPLIVSGAAAKMRGKHTPFAEQQEKKYPQYDLIWSKSFVWGGAHISIDNVSDKFTVEYFTTPRSGNGALMLEPSFSFNHRSTIH